MPKKETLFTVGSIIVYLFIQLYMVVYSAMHIDGTGEGQVSDHFWIVPALVLAGLLLMLGGAWDNFWGRGE